MSEDQAARDRVLQLAAKEKARKKETAASKIEARMFGDVSASGPVVGESIGESDGSSPGNTGSSSGGETATEQEHSDVSLKQDVDGGATQKIVAGGTTLSVVPKGSGGVTVNIVTPGGGAPGGSRRERTTSSGKDQHAGKDGDGVGAGAAEDAGVGAPPPTAPVGKSSAVGGGAQEAVSADGGSPTRVAPRPAKLTNLNPN